MQIFRGFRKRKNPPPKPVQEPYRHLGKMNKKTKREKDQHYWHYWKESKQTKNTELSPPSTFDYRR